MAATETITITFESGAAEHLRRRADERNLTSLSEYLESLIVADMLEPANEAELAHWMKTEGARRLQAFHDA